MDIENVSRKKTIENFGQINIATDNSHVEAIQNIFLNEDIEIISKILDSNQRKIEKEILEKKLTEQIISDDVTGQIETLSALYFQEKNFINTFELGKNYLIHYIYKKNRVMLNYAVKYLNEAITFSEVNSESYSLLSRSYEELSLIESAVKENLLEAKRYILKAIETTNNQDVTEYLLIENILSYARLNESLGRVSLGNDRLTFLKLSLSAYDIVFEKVKLIPFESAYILHHNSARVYEEMYNTCDSNECFKNAEIYYSEAVIILENKDYPRDVSYVFTKAELYNNHGNLYYIYFCKNGLDNNHITKEMKEKKKLALVNYKKAYNLFNDEKYEDRRLQAASNIFRIYSAQFKFSKLKEDFEIAYAELKRIIENRPKGKNLLGYCNVKIDECRLLVMYAEYFDNFYEELEAYILKEELEDCIIELKDGNSHDYILFILRLEYVKLCCSLSKSELSRPRKLRLFQLEMTHFQLKVSASRFIPIPSLTLIQLPVEGYLSCSK